jgi:atlastin
MNAYLKEVIKTRDIKDLQETREQIISCFEKISCYGFCHPGLEVTKKNFDGSIEKIDLTFRSLLDAYTRRIFGNDLEPKRIHGRALTGHDLHTYIKTYVKLFDGGAHFPEATTLLEATSSANNSNAKFAALTKYKADMEAVVGAQSKAGFLEKGDLDVCHENSMKTALNLFDGIATMGRRASITAIREDLVKEFNTEFGRYAELNETRRPFKNFEIYFIPMGVAATAFVLRSMADASCSSWSDTCRKTSNGLSFIYIAIFLFILCSSFSSLRAAVVHISRVMPMLLSGPSNTKGNASHST